MFVFLHLCYVSLTLQVPFNKLEVLKVCSTEPRGSADILSNDKVYFVELFRKWLYFWREMSNGINFAMRLIGTDVE
jgi:hypothetical protein